MNVLRVLRIFLFVVLPLYAVFHIRTTCPLDQDISKSSLTDPLCVYSHKVSQFVEPYFSFAMVKYNASPLKPHVDSIYETSKEFTDPYISKSFGLLNSIKDEAFQRTNITQEELFANLDSGSKLLGQHLTTLINFINYQVTTNVYPFCLQTSNLIIQYSKVVYVKTKLVLYIQWKLYLQPFISIVNYHFFNSEVGKYCIKISKTNEFKLFKFYLAEVKEWFNFVFEYIQEKWINFKEANNAMSMSKSFKLMEDKKNFLLQEFNKFIDNSFNNKGEIVKEEENEREEEEEGEEETETIHSTITITATSIRATPTSSSTSSVKSSEKYKSLLDKTIEGAKIDFESEVSSLSHQLSSNLNANFIEKLQKFGSHVNSNYDFIYDLLNRINLVTEAELSGYVSRQDFRDALEEKRLSFISESEDLSNEIEKYKLDFISKVSVIRNSILEALEEFSDSSLNAYSAEIISNDSDWVEWKNFKSLKSQLISFRDELINLNIDEINDELIKTINGLNNQINILLNEGGSYLAILRAKANLEFQSRESISSEAESVETQTQTVLEIIPLEEIHETQTKTVLEIIPLESKKPDTNGKIVELVDDAIIAGAMEAAYEAADFVEPVIEDVLNAANEMIADAINL